MWCHVSITDSIDGMGPHESGAIIFRTDDTWINNFPRQQLECGRQKNIQTNHNFKKVVRILKRLDSIIVERGKYGGIPSYLIECLAYNCYNQNFLLPSWTERVVGGAASDHPAYARYRRIWSG